MIKPVLNLKSLFPIIGIAGSTLLIFLLFPVEHIWAEPELNVISDEDIPQEIDGLSLVWSDEFDQPGVPNAANWNYEYGFVRNRELQWYQPQNAVCKNGVLIIEGKKESVENQNFSPISSDWRNDREFANYTSSCLITRGLHEWSAGGYYEVRARIDVTKGAWPAIWLLGTEGGWPENGEIDMMEFYRINDEPYILANVAWGSPEKYNASWDSSKKLYTEFTDKDPDWASKFHVWSMKWDGNYIRLYLDKELLNEIDLSKTVNSGGRNPFVGNQKFYLLLNLAIGANGGIPADDEFPISFEVDYVRIYQNLR